MVVCLLLSEHRAVIFAIGQLSCLHTCFFPRLMLHWVLMKLVLRSSILSIRTITALVTRGGVGLGLRTIGICRISSGLRSLFSFLNQT